jgi:hypothetical protein
MMTQAVLADEPNTVAPACGEIHGDPGKPSSVQTAEYTEFDRATGQGIARISFVDRGPPPSLADACRVVQPASVEFDVTTRTAAESVSLPELKSQFAALPRSSAEPATNGAQRDPGLTPQVERLGQVNGSVERQGPVSLPKIAAGHVPLPPSQIPADVMARMQRRGWRHRLFGWLPFGSRDNRPKTIRQRLLEGDTSVLAEARAYRGR